MGEAEAHEAEVVANVFLGNERSQTWMQVGQDGEWTKMVREVREDPFLLGALPTGHPAGDCEHIWVGRLPRELKPSAQLIRVRSRDMWGQEFTGRRIVQVVEGSQPHAPTPVAAPESMIEMGHSWARGGRS